MNKCVSLNSSNCLDITLPYKYTSFSYLSTNATDDDDIESIEQYLSLWKGLRSVPQCWKALQSVLCASFFPRCDNESSRVLLPTYEMCRMIRGPCRLIQYYYSWPLFLRCDNESLFPAKCQNVYTDLKFTNLANVNRCTAPLVQSDDRKIWYPGFDGCALQCHNPVFTEEQRTQVSKSIAFSSMITILSSLFTIFTFIIDKKSFKRYPAVIIFYLNFCIFFSTLGWTLQFVKGRSEIVCSSDNTIRYAEPSKPDNFYCTVSFVLIYYFSFSALVWFVILAYVYDFLYKHTGSSRGALQSQNKHFHMAAWSIPLVLTVGLLLFAEVDGDSLRGICFVGFFRPVSRIFFVFIPAICGVTLALYHMAKSVLLLAKVKFLNDNSNTANSIKKSKKIRLMIIRISLFSIFVLLSLLTSIASYIYELKTWPIHEKSLSDYIVCNLNMSNTLSPNQPEEKWNINNFVDPICTPPEPPKLYSVYSQLFSIFGVCVISSSWVWTSNTIASWKRFINRKCNGDDYNNRPVRLKPFETIAKSYNRRNEITQGTYMPSFASNHNDLVDMDLNSAISQSLSNNFRENFNALLERRCALSGNDIFRTYDSHTNSNICSVSQNLSLSDTSQQQLSVDSHSLSLEQIELASIVRNQRRKTKKERERYRQIHSRLILRRGSDTSGSLISSAYTPGTKLNSSNKVNGKSSATLETKSTSTGDLMNLMIMNDNSNMKLVPNIYPNPIALNSYLAASNILPFLPQATMMRPSLPQTNGHTLNNMTANQVNLKPQPQQQLPVNGVKSPITKPHFASSFPFTHGMSDQSNTLQNPFLEKRRPDSRAVNSNNTASQQLPINGGKSPITKPHFASSFPFTHGMIDQSDTLQNPFLEKRRPDSRTVNSNNTASQQNSNLKVISGNVTNPAESNFSVNNLSTTQSVPMMPAQANVPYLHYMYNGLLNPYANQQMQNMQQQYSMMAINGHNGNYCRPYQPTFPMVQHVLRLPHESHYYNTNVAYMAQQQLQQQKHSPQELQALAQERVAYQQLVTPMRSDSELSNYFPIQISDSEGMASDTNLSQFAYYPDKDKVQKTKKLVEERIQKVTGEVMDKVKSPAKMDNGNDTVKTNGNS